MTDDNGVPIDRDADGTHDINNDYVEIPGEVETERVSSRESEFEGDSLTWAERPLIESGDDLDSGGWAHPLV